MEWVSIIFMAVIVEGLTEYLKLIVPKMADTSWVLAVTMIIGIGVAVAFNIDLFVMLGIPASVPYVGSIISGILISRGSNYMYDLIGKYTDKVRTIG